MRRALFVPCESKAELARWIRVYLDIDFPDCIVSDESNSSPMDMIWEVYSRCKSNDVEDFARVMAYANRGGYKTLGASVLEVLQVLHLRRNVAHMAAIFDQSQKSQEYVRDFFARPYIRDYRLGQNVKKIEVCRYFNGVTGKNLTLYEFAKLTWDEKKSYERVHNYIQIVVCTMAGANSAHTEFFCVDEVDVVPKQHVAAYETAKHIPDPRDGLLPVTLLTSTRKFNYALVQKEIDDAARTGLQLRHWNVIDITERCPSTRHLPDEPHVKLYVDDLNLKHIVEPDFNILDPQAQKAYVEREAFAGCVKCPLFAACKGRLATEQKGETKLLKPIPAIISAFRAADVTKVQTELLCRKPDATGLIYPKFNRHLHMLPAHKFAEMMTGEPQKENMMKAEVMKLMVEKGARFYAGMDFGFTHNFAVVMGAVFGQFMFITTVISIAGLELDEKIAICEPLRQFSPTIFGDPEAPPDIKTFKRKGFQMREWDKYKGSVKGGIEVVRMKLQPAVGTPQLFFLKGDPGCELLAGRLEKYHFITDVAGQVSDEPDDELDDEADALRYLVMNVFAPKGKINLPPSAEIKDVKEVIRQATADMTAGKDAGWMRDKIISLTGENPEGEQATKTVKKGKFFFDG